MSFRISHEEIETIRYGAHAPELIAAMQRLDPHRFRGLGPKRTETFVLHGWETAQRLGLLYLNDAAYMLFLMTFLGSHFLDDLRYEDLASILQYPDPQGPPGFDTRIRRARLAFIALGDRMIGPNASVYLADLGRFSAWIGTTKDLEPYAVLDALLLCHEGREVCLAEPQRQKLLAEAQASAAALNLDGDEGDAVALALRWWLGVRFEDDPLYPWVRDVTARQGDAAARTSALRDYAQRRVAVITRG